MSTFEERKEYYFYLKGRAGGFFTALVDCLNKADSSNRLKLSIAFPGVVEIHTKMRSGDEYYDALCFEVETELGINDDKNAVRVLVDGQPRSP